MWDQTTVWTDVRVQTLHQAFPVNRRNFVRWRGPLQEARARPVRPCSSLYDATWSPRRFSQGPHSDRTWPGKSVRPDKRPVPRDSDPHTSCTPFGRVAPPRAVVCALLSYHGRGRPRVRVRAFLNQPPFELRQRGKDVEDQLARGSCPINRPITQRPKTNVPLEQRLNQGHQMRHRLPQAVEPPNHLGKTGGARPLAACSPRPLWGVSGAPQRAARGDPSHPEPTGCGRRGNAAGHAVLALGQALGACL